MTKIQDPIMGKDFSIPESGLPEEVRQSLMAMFSEYIFEQKAKFLGYQANQKMAYEADTRQFLNCHINNVGDPFVGGNFTVNSKQMEQAVLDYYAKLWHASIPADREKPSPEDYWGYSLTMGSTEGNIYGLYNARDYLSGRQLIVEPEPTTSGRLKQRYLAPVKPDTGDEEKDENAYTPVAFFSQDTHYSIVKAMRVLGISTFQEMGIEKGYKNPLNTVDGSWEGYDEVPSEKGNLGPGSIDIKSLVTLVTFFAERGFPILVNLNFGSTFKGAYDNVKAAHDALMPVFKANNLINRTVEYDKKKHLTDTRNGFWIHVDGALGASYMPFLKMAQNKNPRLFSANDAIPEFDFGLPGINSMVMSGHKWPGAPWPCGLFMTKVKYQLTPPDDPEYLGSPDSTFAGSRNGFTPVILWNFLATHSYDDQTRLALECETTARYAFDQLKTVQEIHPEFFVERTPLSLTVRFKKPNDEIIFKYSLSCESLKIKTEEKEGKPVFEERHYAHIFAMVSATREMIDSLVKDLKEKDAFKREDTKVTLGPGRGWR